MTRTRLFSSSSLGLVPVPERNPLLAMVDHLFDMASTMPGDADYPVILPKPLYDSAEREGFDMRRYQRGSPPVPVEPWSSPTRLMLPPDAITGLRAEAGILARLMPPA